MHVVLPTASPQYRPSSWPHVRGAIYIALLQMVTIDTDRWDCLPGTGKSLIRLGIDVFHAEYLRTSIFITLAILYSVSNSPSLLYNAQEQDQRRPETPLHQ